MGTRLNNKPSAKLYFAALALLLIKPLVKMICNIYIKIVHILSKPLVS